MFHEGVLTLKNSCAKKTGFPSGGCAFIHFGILNNIMKYNVHLMTEYHKKIKERRYIYIWKENLTKTTKNKTEVSTANKSFLLAAKGLIGPLQLFLSSTALSTVLQELSGPSGESGSWIRGLNRESTEEMLSYIAKGEGRATWGRETWKKTKQQRLQEM